MLKAVSLLAMTGLTLAGSEFLSSAERKDTCYIYKDYTFFSLINIEAKDEYNSGTYYYNFCDYPTT